MDNLDVKLMERGIKMRAEIAQERVGDFFDRYETQDAVASENFRTLQEVSEKIGHQMTNEVINDIFRSFSRELHRTILNERMAEDFLKRYYEDNVEVK